MILQPTRLSFCHTESVDWVDDGGTRITSLEHDDFENDTMVFVNSLLNKGPIHRNHRNDVPYTRYIDQMTGLDWAALLCIRPGVASACAWEKLDGKAFCLLMINRPSFREHCDWSKFGGLEWSVLLAENPEFVKNCDTHNGWSKFSDEDWQYLLDERPWMAKFKSTPVSTPEA